MRTTGLNYGNIIDFSRCELHPEEKRYDRITRINRENQRHYVSTKIDYHMLDFCDGIFLNESVLECTNMIEGNGHSYELTGTLELRRAGMNSYYLASTTHHGTMTFNVKIGYLHQLQNLYFVIMGEELKVDIDKLNDLIKL